MIKVRWGESMWRTERKNLYAHAHKHFAHTILATSEEEAVGGGRESKCDRGKTTKKK